MTNENLSGFSGDDELKVATAMAAFVEYHFEAMNNGDLHSTHLMCVLQTCWQTAHMDMNAPVDNALLISISIALKLWLPPVPEVEALCLANPNGALLLCLATFFKFYEELLDSTAMIVQSMLTETIHTVSTHPQKRAKTGRKAKNNQHHRKQ